MTDQDATLKLARAVYGQHVGIDDNEPTRPGKNVFVCPDGKWSRFDPANNDSQAVAVLCWLLGHDHNNRVTHDSIFYVVEDGTGWSKRAEYYDNTPASFRAAVTKAALRVVQG